MAKIILFILITTEISIRLLYIMKRNHKAISIIRISILGLFILLAITNIIIWSFRWYLLATTLTLVAGLSMLSLIKQHNKEVSNVKVVLKAMITSLTFLISIVPAIIFPQYELPVTVNYNVSTDKYTYIDTSRVERFNDLGEHRKVTVNFWYPEDTEQKYPLVVFSHGAFGVSDSNTSTYRELASNGYVVASISHPYHSMYTLETDGKLITADRSFIQEVIDVNNGLYDKETGYNLSHKWLDLRTEDLNFVLDTIINLNKDTQLNDVYSIIDINKIGLMGHSLGGASSAKLGRDRSDIDTVINLDGALIGEEIDFKEGEFIINKDVYPIPILFIYTDDLINLIEKTSDNTVIPSMLILETAKDAYKVHFKDTNHMSLTDLPHFSPFLSNMITDSFNDSGDMEADKDYIINKMNEIILNFLDSTLKGEGVFESDILY